MKFAASRRLYRILLWVLPGEFRRRHGAELEQVFEQHLAEGYERSGWIGAAAVWGRCVIEILSDRALETIRSARRRFSAADRLDVRRHRFQQRTTRRSGFMADITQDLRVGVRTLLRSPGFAVVAVLTLAVGIGANTAIFSLVDAIVLSPLPFDQQDRLVSVAHAAPSRGIANAGQCAAWHLTYEDESRVFEDIGMYGAGSVAVTGVEDPETVQAMFATSGVFRALRTRPSLGRAFTPEDDDPDSPAVMLLSHGYWQSRFGGDPSVIGQTLQVNGNSWEIVGVMPATLSTLGQNATLILPLRFDRATLFVGNIGFNAVARLRDGVTLDQAHADAVRVLPMAWEKFPGGPVSSSNEPSQYTPVLQPLKVNLVGSVANLLWVLLGGVAVVLLIACANVANLFLVRAEAKETEMAVRAAMGAGRRRIGWEFLKESLLLGVAGGIAGLTMATAGLRVLVSMGPAQLPRLDEVSLSTSVLLFAFIVSLGAGALFGMFPALRFGRADLVGALKQGGPSGMRGKDRHRAQNVLAVSQMALALVLLVASGLMLRSFFALRDVDPGFRSPEGVLALRLNIPGNEIPRGEDVALTYETIARRLADVPGVTAVAMGTFIPMDGRANVNPFYVDGVTPSGDGPPPMRRHNWVGEGYFENMRIPLLVGRAFTWEDVHNRIPGVLLSESLAREYFGSAEAALGQRVAARPDPPRWYEVIGVAGDVRYDGMSQPSPLMVYWPQVTLAFWEGSASDQIQTWRFMGYAIRSSRVGTPDFLRAVRDAIWSVNPNLPLRNVSPLTDLMAQSMARTSFTLVLLGIAGGAALLLGIVGVYGVISYAVSQRSREMGMRMALGAQSVDVTRMVLRQGLVLSGIGVAVGLGLAFGLTRVMSSLLFGVAPVDPLTFSLVPSGLMIVVLLASYIPARRAAAIDPMEVLRAE